MTSAVDEALKTLTGHDDMLLSGTQLTENVSAALKTATVTRTIDNAASTLALEIEDAHRIILNSGIFAHRTTAHLSPYTYEVAQVRKTGPGLSVTCEDQVVAELRRHTDPMSVGAGKMTHVQFARRMVSEVRWIKFKTDPHIEVIKSKEPLTRGDPTSKDPAQAESTWDALARMAQDRGWRVFTRGTDELWYVPDSYLFNSSTYYPLAEDNDEVDAIDFDYDQGKPIAQLTATVRSALWTVPPGSLAVVSGLGPANGKWLVREVSKIATSTTSAVTCVKPSPVLPEPSSSDSIQGDGGTGGGATGAGATVGVGSGGVAPSRTLTRFAADFVNEALSQAHKAYVYGSQVSPSNANPTSFDCSALVQWAAARVGVDLPRTSGSIFAAAKKAGTLISVDRAKHIRGALLFLGVAGSEHVVISLGNGQDTIEARGRAYGVNEFSINRDNWSGACMIPGMRY